jgi:hypothetical protein
MLRLTTMADDLAGKLLMEISRHLEATFPAAPIEKLVNDTTGHVIFRATHLDGGVVSVDVTQEFLNADYEPTAWRLVSLLPKEAVRLARRQRLTLL